jgi:predicted neutral ceramidase superfamily lipid hydrolase
MSAVAFDTLKLARKLRDTAQMSQVQAEGVADALAEAMSGAELATKSDLAEAKAELRADLSEVERHLEAKISEVLVAVADTKNDILRWVFAAVVGQTALIVTLIKMWH